jgi:hypothetical protein
MLGHLMTRRFGMDSEITEHGIQESKEAYWQRTLQQWKESGLKACEFQRRNNLSKHAFVYWKLKLMGRSEKRQVLVPVRLHTAARRDSCGIRLRVGELYTVEVSPGFDERTLRAVLAVVRGCAP